ncbi:trichohyalin-like [Drosophila sulfurigaster albostrigata]|uniref:trichohyalin-like n=1 Tax=Drosophila sulfurigaster albostrigata TaxID=89887 RepID=UPI002D219EB7|nr:trichohyalin-like [Drosophila sulfurigaster albostrigata]
MQQDVQIPFKRQHKTPCHIRDGCSMRPCVKHSGAGPSDCFQPSPITIIALFTTLLKFAFMNRNDKNNDSSATATRTLPAKTDYTLKGRLSNEQLDRNFWRHVDVVKALVSQHSQMRDHKLCAKWLSILWRTSMEEKFARNCLIVLMMTQLKRDNVLSFPFNVVSNFKRDVRCVLKDYNHRQRREGTEARMELVASPLEVRVPEPSTASSEVVPAYMKKRESEMEINLNDDVVTIKIEPGKRTMTIQQKDSRASCASVAPQAARAERVLQERDLKMQMIERRKTEEREQRIKRERKRELQRRTEVQDRRFEDLQLQKGRIRNEREHNEMLIKVQQRREEERLRLERRKSEQQVGRAGVSWDQQMQRQEEELKRRRKEERRRQRIATINKSETTTRDRRRNSVCEEIMKRRKQLKNSEQRIQDISIGVMERDSQEKLRQMKILMRQQRIAELDRKERNLTAELGKLLREQEERDRQRSECDKYKGSELMNELEMFEAQREKRRKDAERDAEELRNIDERLKTVERRRLRHQREEELLKRERDELEKLIGNNVDRQELEARQTEEELESHKVEKIEIKRKDEATKQRRGELEIEKIAREKEKAERTMEEQIGRKEKLCNDGYSLINTQWKNPAVVRKTSKNVWQEWKEKSVPITRQQQQMEKREQQQEERIENPSETALDQLSRVQNESVFQVPSHQERFNRQVSEQLSRLKVCQRTVVEIVALKKQLKKEIRARNKMLQWLHAPGNEDLNTARVEAGLDALLSSATKNSSTSDLSCCGCNGLSSDMDEVGVSNIDIKAQSKVLHKNANEEEMQPQSKLFFNPPISKVFAMSSKKSNEEPVAISSGRLSDVTEAPSLSFHWRSKARQHNYNNIPARNFSSSDHCGIRTDKMNEEPTPPELSRGEHRVRFLDPKEDEEPTIGETSKESVCSCRRRCEEHPDNTEVREEPKPESPVVKAKHAKRQSAGEQVRQYVEKYQQLLTDLTPAKQTAKEVNKARTFELVKIFLSQQNEEQKNREEDKRRRQQQRQLSSRICANRVRQTIAELQRRMCGDYTKKDQEPICDNAELLANCNRRRKLVLTKSNSSMELRHMNYLRLYQSCMKRSWASVESLFHTTAASATDCRVCEGKTASEEQEMESDHSSVETLIGDDEVEEKQVRKTFSAMKKRTQRRLIRSWSKHLLDVSLKQLDKSKTEHQQLQMVKRKLRVMMQYGQPRIYRPMMRTAFAMLK